jgi:transcription elongation factor Elf1
MPDLQTPPLAHRVAARPRCPKCQSRMEVQTIAAARSGYEHWTLRCVKCRLIHEAQVNADPTTSDGYRPPESATAGTMT